MDKLAPRPEGSARVSLAGVSIVSALIAGLLAWALVLQGGAIAASAGQGATRAGFDAAAVARCGDDHRRAPEHHADCACCLPGRSGPDLEGLALAAVAAAAPRVPIAELVRPDLPPPLGPVSPRGRIGSWSPRAPPRLDARLFSLRAREA